MRRGGPFPPGAKPARYGNREWGTKQMKTPFQRLTIFYNNRGKSVISMLSRLLKTLLEMLITPRHIPVTNTYPGKIRPENVRIMLCAGNITQLSSGIGRKIAKVFCI